MRIPLIAAATLLAACSSAHLACSDDAGLPAPVGTRTIPWEGVEIRFLGITDWSEGRSDVEVAWEIAHPFPDPPNVWPIFGYHFSDIDFVTRHESGRTEVSARVSIGVEHGWPGGTNVGMLLGLRIAEGGVSPVRWDVPARLLTLIVGPSRPPPRPVSFDGSLEVEPVEIPDVPMRDGFWELGSGVNYELVYRIHNRSDTSREVRIVMSGGEASERVASIPAGDAIDVSHSVRLAEVGFCFRCFGVSAGYVGEERLVDQVEYTVNVVGP